MSMPSDVGIVDTMIGFPGGDLKAVYRFITRQTKDIQSREEFAFPAEYMFKDVPEKDVSGTDDRIGLTLREMDTWGIDKGMYDFPDLVFVTRHGCEPWTELAVKLMLKWPGLHYSTSAFAPKYYPRAVVDYANTRGADKIIYAGYFPMGLSLERIMTEMPAVPFKDDVWPKFLRGNALRVLGLW